MDPSLYRKQSSETYYSFKYISIEFATVADIGCREIFVFLVHVFTFQQHIFGQEPTGGKGSTVYGNIISHASQVAIYGIVAGAHKQVFRFAKAVDHISG